PRHHHHHLLSSVRRRSARRRRRGRGAAVFVVVLVITLLSALGLFALRSSSTAVAASGFNRQLGQTHAITNYAVAATVAVIGQNPQGFYEQLQLGPDVAAGDATCMGYTNLQNPRCLLLGEPDFALTADNPFIAEIGRTMPSGTNSTSLPLEADMAVEVSHPRTLRPVAGQEVAGGTEARVGYTYKLVTVSATGLIRPGQTVPGTWDQASAGAASVELSRAHVVMGPISAPR
ncbi:MAG: hypothetical protein AAGN82_07615, partial [Myxococcota bacterium]